MDCIWEDLQPRAVVSLTLQSVDGRLRRQKFSGKHGQSGLGNFECWFARPAHGFKPAADIHLGVRFAAEMPGGGAGSGSQVPLNDRELLISALDHKPMDRSLTDDPANLALEFLQTRHALSGERWLGKN